MTGQKGQDQDAANEHQTAARQDSQQGPAFHLIEAFLGEWKLEGTGYSANGTSEAKGTQVFRWLEGQYFVEHRWDVSYESNTHKGIAVIGYDAMKRAYIWRQFDNLGYFREYELLLEKGVLTLQGSEERATIGLNAGENEITIDWDNTTNGRDWSPLCHLTGYRSH